VFVRGGKSYLLPGVQISLWKHTLYLLEKLLSKILPHHVLDSLGELGEYDRLPSIEEHGHYRVGRSKHFSQHPEIYKLDLNIQDSLKRLEMMQFFFFRI